MKKRSTHWCLLKWSRRKLTQALYLGWKPSLHRTISSHGSASLYFSNPAWGVPPVSDNANAITRMFRISTEPRAMCSGISREDEIDISEIYEIVGRLGRLRAGVRAECDINWKDLQSLSGCTDFPDLIEKLNHQKSSIRQREDEVRRQNVSRDLANLQRHGATRVVVAAPKIEGHTLDESEIDERNGLIGERQLASIALDHVHLLVKATSATISTLQMGGDDLTPAGTPQSRAIISGTPGSKIFRLQHQKDPTRGTC